MSVRFRIIEILPQTHILKADISLSDFGSIITVKLNSVGHIKHRIPHSWSFCGPTSFRRISNLVKVFLERGEAGEGPSPLGLSPVVPPQDSQKLFHSTLVLLSSSSCVIFLTYFLFMQLTTFFGESLPLSSFCRSKIRFAEPLSDRVG